VDGERRAVAGFERCEFAAAAARALFRVFAVVRFVGIFTSLPRLQKQR
jgi:hypothetical protein